MISTEQIKAARALLNWKQADLAKAAAISETALANLERGATDPRQSTIDAVQRALEAAGVIFIAENGEGPGVRLRKNRKADA